LFVPLCFTDNHHPLAFCIVRDFFKNPPHGVLNRHVVTILKIVPASELLLMPEASLRKALDRNQRLDPSTLETSRMPARAVFAGCGTSPLLVQEPLS
jgi:hypothetical protein